ncbi:MAG TPA: S8 family serine peptidase [Gammaproteobacteria bacterium]|nr:S8 family serine peptidase [Gammaproteobacteria bacterium]
MRASSVVLGLVSAVVACGAFAQQRLGPPSETNPVRHQPTDAAARLGDTPRMIVKFRSTGSAGVAQIQSAASQAATSAAVTKFAARAGVNVSEARALAAGMHALRLEPRAGETFAQQLARVRLDPDVEFAVPDERRFAHAVPNDPLYNGQWYLQNGAYVASSTDPTLNTQPSAIHAQAAWDVGVGSSTLVIAVLDTGVLYNHPDLTSRLLPGYDFIADTAVANDGNGRDADATDAGDWVTLTESQSAGPFSGCDPENSSWHGTRVAGIIGAAANNSTGVTGVTWNPKILPVRVLGKCGGFDSDIIDGMAWAAGLHVTGVPDNPQANWAKVENLSLGSIDSCADQAGQAYQTVISQLTARGVIVVASAGNEAGPVDTPANCPGVVAVAGLRHTGTKVGYSSLGPEVTVGAPGGNCVNVNGGPCLFSINTTANDGATTAGNNTYTDQTNFNVGTSFSAPIVSGIVGLMRSVNGTMTPAQLIARLQQGATAYPAPAGVPVCPASDPNSGECTCTTSTCGAGMANAENALQGALRPMAIISGAAPSSVTPGSTANLSGSTSFTADGRTIGSYLWSIVSGTGTLTSMSTADTSIVTPSSGGVTVRLTVTDDAGRQDSADWIFAQVSVTISPTSASVQAGGGTQTFTATVVNATNQGVTWQVNGVTFGSALVGTVSVFGVYTAPATVPSPATVTVTAISNQDPTRMASAQVTITAPAAPPSSGGGGGGGGGALDLLGLLCLVALGRRFAPAWLRARRES